MPLQVASLVSGFGFMHALAKDKVHMNVIRRNMLTIVGLLFTLSNLLVDCSLAAQKLPRVTPFPLPPCWLCHAAVFWKMALYWHNSCAQTDWLQDNTYCCVFLSQAGVSTQNHHIFSEETAAWQTESMFSSLAHLKVTSSSGPSYFWICGNRPSLGGSGGSVYDMKSIHICQGRLSVCLSVPANYSQPGLCWAKVY